MDAHVDPSPATKPCPYCAEPIRAEAIVCKHCGRGLPVVRPPVSPLTLAWVYLVLLAGEIAFVVLFSMWDDLAWNSGVPSCVSLAFALSLPFLHGALAVKDRYPGPQPVEKKILVFALAFMPIGSFFATYWAARFIAGRGSASVTLFSLTMLAPVAIVAYALAPLYSPVLAAAFESPASGSTINQASRLTATASYRRLTAAAARATPTARARATPTIRVNPTRCLDAGQITLAHVGLRECVRGRVWRDYEREGTYFIEFSARDGALYMLSYDKSYASVLRPGNCVQATGLIERLGGHPVMVVKLHDTLYNCEP